MNTEDIKKRYAPLSDIKMPSDVRDKIVALLSESAPIQSGKFKRRRTAWTMIGGVAVASLAAGLLLPHVLKGTQTSNQPEELGVGNGSSTYGSGSVTSAITWAIPAKIKWDGQEWRTLGPVQSVGSVLGKSQGDTPLRLFYVPGVNSDKEIAVEVDTPKVKYVAAVPVQTSK